MVNKGKFRPVGKVLRDRSEGGGARVRKVDLVGRAVLRSVPISVLHGMENVFRSGLTRDRKQKAR